MNIKHYKQQLLYELYKPFLQCTKCPLAKDRTSIIFGEGNPDASLMIIGEGPGKEEDKQGRPFVGRSGKLLDNIFNLLSIKRSSLFISNIVKCRPPQNRKPTSYEMKTCTDLLLKHQIKIINPTVVCTLGATALQALTNETTPISKARGIPISIKSDFTLIPTYHPAYILRNPKELQKMVNDIKKAFSLL